MDLKAIGCGVDSCGSGQEPVACPCEHGNEHSSSIKGESFVDLLLLKKVSGP
jgi:hypothetical protein